LAWAVIVRDSVYVPEHAITDFEEPAIEVAFAKVFTGLALVPASLSSPVGETKTAYLSATRHVTLFGDFDVSHDAVELEVLVPPVEVLPPLLVPPSELAPPSEPAAPAFPPELASQVPGTSEQSVFVLRQPKVRVAAPSARTVIEAILVSLMFVTRPSEATVNYKPTRVLTNDRH
jgi:hypothetical protein